MSQAARPPEPDDSDRSGGRSGMNPRRGRAAILGTVVVVILGIFAVLLLVTRCGDSADDVSGSGVSGPAEVVLLVPTAA